MVRILCISALGILGIACASADVISIGGASSEVAETYVAEGGGRHCPPRANGYVAATGERFECVLFSRATNRAPQSQFADEHFGPMAASMPGPAKTAPADAGLSTDSIFSVIGTGDSLTMMIEDFRSISADTDVSLTGANRGTSCGTSKAAICNQSTNPAHIPSVISGFATQTVVNLNIAVSRLTFDATSDSAPVSLNAAEENAPADAADTTQSPFTREITVPETNNAFLLLAGAGGIMVGRRLLQS